MADNQQSNQGVTPASSVSATETVRAAFDRFQQQFKGDRQGGGGKLGGSPVPGPSFPPAAFPWAPGIPLPWGAQPPPPTAGPVGPAAPQPPLFESLGQVLRLGVTLTNAVLNGGLQVMQGFNGPAAPPDACGGPMRGGCGCGGACGGHAPERGCGCARESACCASPCGCHPGVRNCRG